MTGGTEEYLINREKELEDQLSTIKELKNRGVERIEIPIDEKNVEEARQKLCGCYEGIIQILKSYIDTSEDNYKLIALWIVGTYFHNSFNTFPYLFFNAMRGSGKTRTLKLISALGAKGDGSIQNNITEAVLFRIPRGTTTCIDEVEQIGNKEKQTLRELLNSAYKKGMKVKRMRKSHTKEGEKQIVEEFEPYFPICMANISGLEEVLADRSIVLILEKSDNKEVTLKIEDFDTNQYVQHIKRTLGSLSAVSVVTYRQKSYLLKWNSYIVTKYTNIINNTNNTNVSNNIFGDSLNKKEEVFDAEVLEFFNKVHDLNITSRNFELFFPLLILARFMSSALFDDIAIIASRISNKRKDEEMTESVDVSVYQFVSSMKERGMQYIFMKELYPMFKNYLGEEYDWMSDKWFGKSLKRLNLLLDKKKVASGRMVLLNYVKATEKLKLFKSEEK